MRELFDTPVVDLLPARRRGLPGLAIGVELGGLVMRIATTRQMAAEAAARHVPVVSPLEVVSVAWAVARGPLSAARATGEELGRLKRQHATWPRSGAAEWPSEGVWWPGVVGECGAQFMPTAPTFGFVATRLGMKVLGVRVDGEHAAPQTVAA
jgi:hypothetical protein